jgi:hypothetical protein
MACIVVKNGFRLGGLLFNTEYTKGAATFTEVWGGRIVRSFLLHLL